jgi:hypothetical protein
LERGASNKRSTVTRNLELCWKGGTDPEMESPTNDRLMSRPIGRRELLGGAAKVTAASSIALLLAGSATLPAVAETAAGRAAGTSVFDAAVAGLLADIRHGDTATRQFAAERAALAGTTAIAPLGVVCAGTDPGAAKAAWEAVQRIAHNAARPGAAEERQSAARRLLALTAAEYPRQLRAGSLRLLGMVGGPAEVAAISDLLHVPSLREDARMALERIPGPAAETALRNAARTVPADYRPALAQSLRSRKAKPREVGLRS